MSCILGMSNKALADRILLTDKPMTLVVAGFVGAEEYRRD